MDGHLLAPFVEDCLCYIILPLLLGQSSVDCTKCVYLWLSRLCHWSVCLACVRSTGLVTAVSYQTVNLGSGSLPTLFFLSTYGLHWGFCLLTLATHLLIYCFISWCCWAPNSTWSPESVCWLAVHWFCQLRWEEWNLGHLAIPSVDLEWLRSDTWLFGYLSQLFS